MITRYEAWLNKKSLSAIDPSIYIRDITYGAPTFSITANDIPGRNGQRVTSVLARSTGVVVTIEIHEQDVARRQDVCRRVQQWAMGGGELTTNDRRGQRLRVICEEPPSIASALKWTQALKMLFRTYAQPFWEDEYPRSATDKGGGTTLYAPGFGDRTRVEAKVKNTSSQTVNTLTLHAGGTQMTFSGLGLASNATLVIDYDENDLLRIRVGNASKLGCRTAASDDDLMIKTGAPEALSATANAGVTATFYARGLYL